MGLLPGYRGLLQAVYAAPVPPTAGRPPLVREVGCPAAGPEVEPAGGSGAGLPAFLGSPSFAADYLERWPLLLRGGRPAAALAGLGDLDALLGRGEHTRAAVTQAGQGGRPPRGPSA